MKKSIVLFFALISFSVISAQNWFGSFSQGYALGIHKNTLITSRGSYQNSQTDYRKSIAASLGKGFYTDLKIGRLLDKNSFIEIGIRQQFATPLKTIDDSYSRSSDSSSRHQNVKNKISARSFLGQISTGFIYGVNKKSNINVKVGVLLGTSNVALDNDIIINNTPDSTMVTTVTTLKRRWEYQSAINLGFITSVNYQYQLNKNWGLSFELWYQLLNSRISKTTLAVNKINGVDIDDRNSSYFIYHNGKDNEYTVTNDEDIVIESFVIPMSAVGLSVGLLYTF